MLSAHSLVMGCRREGLLQRQQLLTLPALRVLVVVLEEAQVQALVGGQEVQLGAVDHKLSGRDV